MRVAYSHSSWGVVASLVNSNNNLIMSSGGDVSSSGMTISSDDCSLQIIRGSTELYFSLIFTPFKNGTLYRFDTKEKICDCVSNTPVTIANNVYYTTLNSSANYVFK